MTTASDRSVGAVAAPTDAGGTAGVRALVFLRDRGILVLWLLLVALFAVWARPYFLTLDNAALVANAAALTAIFAASVGFGIRPAPWTCRSRARRRWPR